jgi:DNA-binding XRE family transcriptional regulator
LEYIRRSLRLTQKELASKLRVNQSTISRWEKGIGLEGLSIKEIVIISNLLGICPVAVMCLLINYLKHCNAMGGEIKFNECYLMKKYHKDFMEGR